MFQKIFRSILVLLFLLNISLAGNVEASSVFNASIKPSISPVSFVQGLSLLPEDALVMDFLLHEGAGYLQREDEGRLKRFIEYFLTALTVPSERLWVNLSPLEPDRIIDVDLARTSLGKGLLEQDYVLKKMSAALTHPETELGQKYWEHIYQRVYDDFGSVDIPLDSAQKVWIVPGDIQLQQTKSGVVIVESRLKVMTQEDYDVKAFQAHDSIKTDAFREEILPVLEQEVNECEEFKDVRDIFRAAILASWFKHQIRESIWTESFIDQSRIKGFDSSDPQEKERVFREYLRIFSQGLYDLVRENYNPLTQAIEKRRYISGGLRVVPSFEDMRIIPVHTLPNFPSARVEFLPLEEDSAMLGLKSFRIGVAFSAFVLVMLASSVQGFSQNFNQNPDGPWLESVQGRENIVLSRDYGRVQRPEQTHSYAAFKANPKVLDLIKSHVSRDDVKSAIDGTNYDAFQKKQLKSFVDQNYGGAFTSVRYSIMDEWMVFTAQGKLGLKQDGDLGPATEKKVFETWASVSEDVPAPIFQDGSGGSGAGGDRDSLGGQNNFGIQPGSFLSDDDHLSVDTNNLVADSIMPVVHFNLEEEPSDSVGSALQDTTSKPMFFGFHNLGHHGDSSPPPPPPIKENLWNWLQYELNVQAGSQTDTTSSVYDFEGSLQLNAGKLFKLPDSLQLMLGSRFFAHKFPEEVDLHHRIERFEHANEEEHEGEEEHEEEDGHEEHKNKLVEVVPFIGLNLEMPGDIETGIQVMPFGETRWFGGHISQAYFWGPSNRRSSASWNFQPWLSWGHERMSVFKIDLTARLAFSDRLTVTPAIPIVISNRVDAGFNARVDWKLRGGKQNNLFLAYSQPARFRNPLFEEAFEPVFHQHPTAIIAGLATKKNFMFDVQWRNPGKPYQSLTAGVLLPLRSVKEKPKALDQFDVVVVSHGNHVHYKYVPKGSFQEVNVNHLPKDLRALAKHPDLVKYSLGLPVKKQMAGRDYWVMEYHNEHWEFILLGHLKDYLQQIERVKENDYEGHEHNDHGRSLLKILDNIQTGYLELPPEPTEDIFIPVPAVLSSLDLKPYFNGQKGDFRVFKDDGGWRVRYIIQSGVRMTRYTPGELIEEIRSADVAGKQGIIDILLRFDLNGYLFKVPENALGHNTSDKAQLYGGIDLKGIGQIMEDSSSDFRQKNILKNSTMLQGMTFRIIGWQKVSVEQQTSSFDNYSCLYMMCP